MTSETSVGSLGRVLCAVVTFNGGETAVATVASAARLDYGDLGLLVIDNASMDGTGERIAQGRFEVSVEVKILDGNHGLGHAFNRVLEQAVADGYDWMLLLDQDTDVPRDLLRQFEKGYRNLNDRDQVGLLVPRVFNGYRTDVLLPPLRWNGDDLVPVESGELEAGAVRVDSANSSGSLLRVSTCRELGGFREDLFIDYVDHEYNMRVRSNGRKAYCVPGATVEHRLGAERVVSDGSGERVYREHPPFRYYYMARNYVFCHRRLFGGHAGLGRLVGDVWSKSADIRRFDGSPMRSMCFVARGVVDGLLGRLGRRLLPGG